MAEVVTGEAVVLDLAVARFPSRMAALLLDLLVQYAALLVLLLVIFVGAARQLDLAALTAIWLTSYIMVMIGYATIFETLSRGKTLGKMALGLRVISDDGSPIRFRQALFRALSLYLIELPLPFIGLITAMISARGKRLGDIFAGTFVIQERAPQRQELPPGMAIVPLPLAGWAQVLELSRLSDQNAAAASSYLRRFHDLRPEIRDGLGLQLASAVAAQVSPPPPPGTPPAAYLSAVLAVRRDREHARMMALAAPGSANVPGPARQPPGIIPALYPDTGPAFAGDPMVALPREAVHGDRPNTEGQAAAGQAAAGQAAAGQPDAAQSAPEPPLSSTPDDHGFAVPF